MLDPQLVEFLEEDEQIVECEVRQINIANRSFVSELCRHLEIEIQAPLTTPRRPHRYLNPRAEYQTCDEKLANLARALADAQQTQNPLRLMKVIASSGHLIDRLDRFSHANAKLKNGLNAEPLRNSAVHTLKTARQLHAQWNSSAQTTNSVVPPREPRRISFENPEQSQGSVLIEPLLSPIVSGALRCNNVAWFENTGVGSVATHAPNMVVTNQSSPVEYTTPVPRQHLSWDELPNHWTPLPLPRQSQIAACQPSAYHVPNLASYEHNHNYVNTVQSHCRPVPSVPVLRSDANRYPSIFCAAGTAPPTMTTQPATTAQHDIYNMYPNQTYNIPAPRQPSPILGPTSEAAAFFREQQSNGARNRHVELPHNNTPVR